MSLTPERLEDLRGRINARLGGLYTEGPSLLVEPVRYALAGAGKRLRPILTLLTAEACGGGEEAALPAAVSVELLHNFTLVHDDIMDRDHTRHGQASVHTKWDDGVALLAGDAMLVLALAELHKSPRHVEALASSFTAGALAVCEGQALDKEFESHPQVSLDEYNHMIDLKTGSMLGLATEMGAIAAGADPERVEQAKKFGQLLGRAFQIQDDLLEIYSDTDKMGKSLGSDILAEKKTYLMVLALDQFPDELAGAVERARTDLETGLQALRGIFERNGLKLRAEETVQSTISQARERLKSLGPGSQVLADFADLVLARDR
ncbi:MAG: polyprenyl synthetase family protein [Candidatus Neomarinimicrobiota bacterium]